jgi:hypothetical protein
MKQQRQNYSHKHLGKSDHITGLDRPLGFQEVEAPRFLDNRHMKVVRLSAICTSRLYHPENTPGTHFLPLAPQIFTCYSKFTKIIESKWNIYAKFDS